MTFRQNLEQFGGANSVEGAGRIRGAGRSKGTPESPEEGASGELTSL